MLNSLSVIFPNFHYALNCVSICADTGKSEPMKKTQSWHVIGRKALDYIAQASSSLVSTFIPKNHTNQISSLILPSLLPKQMCHKRSLSIYVRYLNILSEFKVYFCKILGS